MKTFLRFFRSARNRRKNSRIPLLWESMKSFNTIGDGKIPWENVTKKTQATSIFAIWRTKKFSSILMR